jgi:hypothetical protein
MDQFHELRFNLEQIQSNVDRLLSESGAFQGRQKNLYIIGKYVSDCADIVCADRSSPICNVLHQYVVPLSNLEGLLEDLKRIQSQLRDTQDGVVIIKLTVKYCTHQGTNQCGRLHVEPDFEDQFNDSSTTVSKQSVPTTINVQEPKEDDSEVTHDHAGADTTQFMTNHREHPDVESPTQGVDTPPSRNQQSLMTVERGTPTLSTLNESNPTVFFPKNTDHQDLPSAREMFQSNPRNQVDLHDTPLSPHIGFGAEHESIPSGGTTLGLLVPLLEQLESSPRQWPYHLEARPRPHPNLKKQGLCIALGIFSMAILYNEVMSMIVMKHQKDEDPTDRRTQVLECGRILSKGRGLTNTNDTNRTAQWKSVNWLTEGAGRSIDIPNPCVWGSSFGSLYALIVTRESLGVPDESWHRTKPLARFDQVCRWKRIICDIDQETVKRLTLNHAGLNGTIPIEIAGLEELAELEMENNNVMGTIPSELGEMTNLEYLFLQETFLTGTIPYSLGRLSALKQLLLDKTRLTGSMPLEVCQLRKMALDSLHADCRGGGVFGSPAVECEYPHCCTSCS